MELHYTKPAEFWDQALPVGNGRLGAMVFGGTVRERIQLNEEGLWSGGPQDRVNPDSAGALERVRALFRAGQVEEAQRLAVSALSGTPYTQRMYQTLGDLWLDFFDPEDGPVTGYGRGLDLDRAAAWTRFRVGGTAYERRVFTSRPADCLVIRLTARGVGALSFTARLDRRRHIDFSGHDGNGTLLCGGDQGGIGWAMGLRVLASDGTWEVLGARMTVRGARDVTLVFTARTQIGGDAHGLGREVSRQLRALCAGPDPEALWRAHVEDHRALFDRVKLRLGREDRALEALPTDQRLRRFAEGAEDPGLAALYFQYARYLMIAGSRPGGLPLTLQGLWNEEFMPPWDSKYTININLEMNYWLADVGGLPECTEPYFALLRRVCENGKDTARRMYGCRGFVAHHNTDIHGDTAPQDEYIPASYWVLGGAWMATAVRTHWEYTKNLDFLAKTFPVLQEAVAFFVDFLQVNEHGHLVTLPSVSPENSYELNGRRVWMCQMPTMDIEILTDLLTGYLAAAAELGTGALVTEAREMLAKLPPLQIGPDGRLLEWDRPYPEPEPGHRHISHLYGLYPSGQIDPEDTPELAEAARRSLEFRLSHGGGHTGWSRAWIVLFWARLRQGDRAWENLRALFADSTFENLMDSHPSKGRERGRVFQIDGNMGAAAGIAELLVQSHNDRIQILPALPAAWPEGSVDGLRVRGNGEVSIRWRDGRLTDFQLLAHSPLETTVVYGREKQSVCLAAGETWRWPEGA